MKREEKSAVIDELAEDLGEAQAIFAVDYKGISVPQAAELRDRLRESDAQFKVVKNRLAKLAAAKAGTQDIDDLLEGPIALTLIKGDPVVVAKTITTFAKENEVLEYRGGFMDGARLDPDGFQAIARLPGRDVLHGQLVGLAASPLTGLVAGLSNLISGLGRQLAQIAEQGLVTGEAPAAAPADAEESSEAEAPAEAEAEAPEPEAPVDEPTPDEAPVEEPPADEPAPEPEASEEPAAEEASEEPAAEETSDEPDSGSDPEAESEEPSAGSDPEAETETADQPDEGSDPSDAAGDEPETEED